jgi:hypothetical protein
MDHVPVSEVGAVIANCEVAMANQNQLESLSPENPP